MGLKLAKGSFREGCWSGFGLGAAARLAPRDVLGPNVSDTVVYRSSHGDESGVDPVRRFLHVQPVKTGEEDVSDEEDEDEIEDGRGLVVKAVIEAPVLAKGVEDAVLDLPPFVADLAELVRGDEVLGNAGGPEPGGDSLALNPPTRHSFALGPGLLRAQDSKGGLDGVGGKALLVPVADVASILRYADQVRLSRKKRLGVGQKRRVVVFEDGQEVLAVLAAEIKEGTLPVEGVALDGVEEASVTTHESLSQTPGGDDLALAGLNHLDVEHDRQMETHEVGHNAPMVVLGDASLVALLAGDYLSLAAPIAVAFSTGKKTRDRRGPRTAEARGSHPVPCFALGGD